MKQNNRDFSLDILRVLACAMVFGVHFGQQIAIPGALGVFFSKGSTGVGFFFILSGYLAYASLDRMYDMYKSDIKLAFAFWIKKLLRILPLYYFVILFYAVFFYIFGRVPEDETGLYWIRYLLFANSFVRANNSFWTNLGAVWSISCFVFFYFISPLCYKYLKNYWVAWAFVIGSYGLLKYIDLKNIYNLPLRWLFYFFLGILVFLSCKECRQLHAITIMFLITLFCILTEKGTALISPLLAAMFILATRNIKMNGDHRIIMKCVSGISKISYSIYLIHVVVIEVMGNLVGLHEGVYAILLITCSLVGSVIIYNLVEKRLGGMLTSATMKLVG